MELGEESDQIMLMGLPLIGDFSYITQVTLKEKDYLIIKVLI